MGLHGQLGRPRLLRALYLRARGIASTTGLWRRVPGNGVYRLHPNAAQPGLLAAMIQRKDLDREHSNTVFCTNVMLSVILAGLSILFSRWWAAINHLPELIAIISTLSLCIPIEGLAIVQIALLQRKMDFRTLSLRANASVLLGGAVGVTMAYSGYGVWSLVGQQIARISAPWPSFGSRATGVPGFVFHGLIYRT